MDDIACDAEHDPPRPATATAHVKGSGSAANCTFVCDECKLETEKAWADSREEIIFVAYP